MKLNTIGFIILSIVWPLSYYLKYIKSGVPQILVDYIITIGYCIGTALIAYYYGKKCKRFRKKVLFYYSIAILNISIVIAYIIDFAADSFFSTKKVIYTIILTSVISLCIYLFSPRY